MFTDDTKLIIYTWKYRTAGGEERTYLACYDYERKGVDLEAELEKARLEHPDARIMTLLEYEQLEREIILAPDVYEIDEETFHEMLNVLPPLKWCDRACERLNVSVNEFCMSEFDASHYTHQYARAFVDGETRYYGATVDYFDESTWIHSRL